MYDLVFVISLFCASPSPTSPVQSQAVDAVPTTTTKVVSSPTIQTTTKVVKSNSAKHAILFFTASWCPSCVKMKSQTLPKVLLPGHELKIIDVDANPQLSDSYQIHTLPAYVVLDSAGRAYRHGVGFRNVRQFIDFLNVKNSK